ncbi:MAG: hypothetical protein COV47_06025 [Candidatus Diapherotrites archaeon CG11_big_fil_rev_8_21_14_0_20_37_9]|nr:MAG: hypothetical protein COV47_06025 [Candidatus Diapherotrites archaeon CG11_big_fil_rev_8_21_14_0_20_37_9]
MVKSKTEKKETISDPLVKRFDALIRLFIETNKINNEKFNDGIAARLLKSVDLTPTEIAKILGKKSATDVAPYLYPKKKNNKTGEKNDK